MGGLDRHTRISDRPGEGIGGTLVRAANVGGRCGARDLQIEFPFAARICAWRRRNKQQPIEVRTS